MMKSVKKPSALCEVAERVVELSNRYGDISIK